MSDRAFKIKGDLIELAGITGGNWETVVGGNFLEVWQSGKHAEADPHIHDHAAGKVAELALPNVYEGKAMTFGEAIAQTMTRARLIAMGPRMLRFIIEMQNEMRAYIPEDETDAESPLYWAFQEMSQIINHITKGDESTCHNTTKL